MPDREPHDDPLTRTLRELDARKAKRENPEPCAKCDGDGYTETWNEDQSGVVVTLCTDCGPGPGDFDA